MRNWREFAAMFACIGMIQLSLADFALAGEARWHEAIARSYVDDVGIGAEVQVELTTGETVRGPISTIGERAFSVDVGRSEAFEVHYTRVRDMEITGLSFKGDIPDPIAVRRVVIGFGPETHVMVRTAADGELRGQIRQIEDDSFQLVLDEKHAPTEIRYDDVLQIGKNLSTGATIAIVVGIVVAAVVIVAVSISNDLDNILGR